MTDWNHLSNLARDLAGEIDRLRWDERTREMEFVARGENFALTEEEGGCVCSVVFG